MSQINHHLLILSVCSLITHFPSVITKKHEVKKLFGGVPSQMHLSFSLSATDSGTTAPVGSQVIHLFLQSVGVTLTEVQDVVFRYTMLGHVFETLK